MRRSPGHVHHAALALALLVATPARADSLISTYNNDNSGHSGCIFDLVALQDVTINSFDTNVSAGVGGDCSADVWFKTGSGYADVTNPGAWTALGSASGISPAGSGNPTALPIPFEIEIHAGDTTSFYVDVYSCPLFGGLRYSWGDDVGDVVAQDGHLQILDGYCLDHSFSGPDEPRTWNGTVHYTQGLLCLGVDDDGDGHTDCDDCDETDATIYPGAPELCDGLDNDCDGIVGDAVDGDGDGVTACDGDCDDAEPEAYPGNAEVCDGIDNDCNGAADDGVADDLDGDGVNTCQGDCDDSDPAVYPGADDECDGVDSDCGNDLYLEIDDDQDGLSECEGDCDDGTSLVHPGHAEECDGLDNDCDPLTDENADVDGDGQTPCGGDCDDGNALVFFGADDVCDGFDNDCDGVVDNGFDGDGDGYSPCGDGVPDCDDEDPTVHPGAEEIPYDGVDNDCSDGDLTDVDGDGFDGGPQTEDCDDEDPFVHPDADEICDDGVDNDCDAHYDGDDAQCFGDDDDSAAADDEAPLGACLCSPNEGVEESSMAAIVALGLLWGGRRRFPPP